MMNYKLWSCAAVLCIAGTACGGDTESNPSTSPIRRRDSGTTVRDSSVGTGVLTNPTLGLDAGSVVVPTNPIDPGGDGGVTTTPIDPTDPVDGSVPPNTSGEIPCDVQTVLASKCQTCHSETPVLGAPMPLVTVADFAAARPSGMTAAQASLARIHDSASPMPPVTNNQLTESEMAILDGWLNGGTPARAEGEMCESTGPVTELPCEVTHHFYSHADGDMDAVYQVPTGQNEYIHFWFRSPFTSQNQAIAWAPHIDNTTHVHHYILYRTDSPPAGVTDGSVTVGGGGAGTFVMGWAPGKGADVMPDDIGVELAETNDEWFYLQVHYWNPQGVSGQTDMSGVDICVIDQPRENTAAILTMPGFGQGIQPRTEGTWSGVCRPRFRFGGPGEIFFLGSGPHMHEIGTDFSTVITRANGQTEDLIRLPTWTFDEQVSYGHDPAVRVGVGDTLRTTCNYFNTYGSTVNFGEGTEDEMCFNFALVYPIDALDSRFCYSAF